jgi:hypothetical protein
MRDITTVQSYEHDQTTLRNLTLEADCLFLDMAHITKDFGTMPECHNDKTNLKQQTIYQDRLHFCPWIYKEFNNILLNVLGNSGS